MLFNMNVQAWTPEQWPNKRATLPEELVNLL